MIQFVYLPNRKKVVKFKRSKENYRGRYKLDGQKKPTDISLYTTDKRVAEQKLEKIVQEAQQEQAGIIAPKEMRDAAGTPVAEHLANFVADLKTKGRAKKHYSLTQSRGERLIDECSWQHLKDITSHSFLSWRAKQKKLSAKSLNEYLIAINSMLNWLQKHNCILANPLANVEKVSTVGKETFKRRALTDDEVKRLLEVSEARRPIYLTALLTGLRRKEINSLVCADFSLYTDKPTISLRAENAKNDKAAVFQLRADLASELRKIIPANAKPTSKPWKMPRSEAVKRDLIRAGIELEDARGRRVDFHALRHTLGTNLARAGVAPRVAMEIMRHSDMRLTMKIYTDEGMLPTAPAFAGLPQYMDMLELDKSEEAKKRSHDLQKRSQKPVSDCHSESASVAVVEGAKNEKSPEKQGFSQSLSQSDGVCQKALFNESDGARTRNLWIDSPVL
tara:strand:- start:811 stop:2157 length:1347 start_codon:yes stop_codon:yes gene_type:complete